MATPKKLGNFTSNDIELCRTTNLRAVNRTVEALIDASIPFSKSSQRIPFFQRGRYNGAKEMLVIMINPHSYGQARRVIDTMDVMYRKRLKVSNY